jgi:hypothetical protein
MQQFTSILILTRDLTVFAFFQSGHRLLITLVFTIICKSSSCGCIGGVYTWLFIYNKLSKNSVLQLCFVKLLLFNTNCGRVIAVSTVN